MHCARYPRHLRALLAISLQIHNIKPYLFLRLANINYFAASRIQTVTPLKPSSKDLHVEFPQCFLPCHTRAIGNQANYYIGRLDDILLFYILIFSKAFAVLV